MKKIVLLITLTMLLSGCATPYPRPQDKRAGIYHKVKEGETLNSICRAYNMSVDDVIDSNHIPDANKLSVGQLIFIPDKK